MTPISSARKLTRRMMLKATATAGGGLILNLSIPRLNAALAAEPDADFAPNAFVRIDPDSKVTFTIPQVEMGQGIYTALSMILAEELDAPFEHVTAVAAPPNDKLYANPLLGFQVTGGSTSVRAFWKPMRIAGASARAMLVEAAAANWAVDPSSCRTENGEVLHDASSRKAAYGELTQAAAALTPPQNPPLKSPANFKLIGKSMKRLDTPDKLNGKAVYGIDARPAGVRIATLASCPVFGGKVAHVDEGRAKTMPGVRQIVVLDDLVAVVGDHMWAAKQGLDALDITWDEGPNAGMSTADVLNGLIAASEKEGAVAKSTGDAAKALAEGTRLDATYHVPFLAHAPMEPANCTVHVRSDACEIWVGNQVITRAQGIAAQLTGLPPDKVIVHNHLIGGGFGRRLEVDYIGKAVRIAQKVDGPVKVIWTREEDIQQALYRPFYFDRFSASLSNGRITAWSSQDRRLVDTRALGASGLQERARFGRRRRRGRFPLRRAEPSCRIRARRAARRADLLLAKRGSGPQYLRRGEFRRRAGACSGAGSGRLSAGASCEGAAASRLPQPCGGEGGLGGRASNAGCTRRRLPERVRLVRCGDRGGRGRQRRRDRYPPRDGGGRLRHGGQSRRGRGADPGRPHLRAHRRPL